MQQSAKQSDILKYPGHLLPALRSRNARYSAPLQKSRFNKNFAFVMLSVDLTCVEKVKKFIAKKGHIFLVYLPPATYQNLPNPVYSHYFYFEQRRKNCYPAQRHGRLKYEKNRGLFNRFSQVNSRNGCLALALKTGISLYLKTILSHLRLTLLLNQLHRKRTSIAGTFSVFI